MSPAMVARAPTGTRLALDEEALPFSANQFDLVVSALSLHWVNDLPGALLQIQRTLRPDGLFLASLYGGDTLGDLRAALTDAELEISDGASPRVSPFVDVRDAGMLLQRAGFSLPVVDAETITVSYPDPLALLHDIRGMGEANALLTRHQRPLRRAVLQRLFEHYANRHASDVGRITASFQIVTLTGWKPHASQPKPLRRGSAAQRLAEALDADETPAGETTMPSGRK
jgi:SAM-dependent methyltransferase